MSTLGTGRDRRDPQPLGQGWELPVIAAGGIADRARPWPRWPAWAPRPRCRRSGWVWPAGTQTMTTPSAACWPVTPAPGCPPRRPPGSPPPSAVYIARRARRNACSSRRSSRSR